MTTSTHAPARHRSAAATPAITALSASVLTGARRYHRRSAVIAVSSGLLVTMGLPAVAVTTPPVEEPEAPASTLELPAVPVESVTAVVAVDLGAQVDLALDGAVSVDSSQAEAREAAAAQAEAERVAAQQAAATAAALASRAGASQVSRSTGRSAAGAVTAAATTTAASSGAAVSSGGAPGGGGSGGGAVGIAQRYLGTPYAWGGTTPAGFDCSGLVQYVYGQMGVSLPRTAAAQQSAGRRVSAAEARAGDIVSFTGSGGVYHNGLYAGNGQVLDAPRAGKSVSVRPIWSSSVTFTRVG